MVLSRGGGGGSAPFPLVCMESRVWFMRVKGAWSYVGEGGGGVPPSPWYVWYCMY